LEADTEADTLVYQHVSLYPDFLTEKSTHLEAEALIDERAAEADPLAEAATLEAEAAADEAATELEDTADPVAEAPPSPAGTETEAPADAQTPWRYVAATLIWSAYIISYGSGGERREDLQGKK
jgi:hypothetical protein